MKNKQTVLKITGLLLCMAMIASCVSPFNRPQSEQDGGIPAGMGRVELSVAASEARTLFPEGLIYEAEYTNGTGVEGVEPFDAYGNATVELSPGAYTFVIYAYNANIKVGESDPLTITVAAGKMNTDNKNIPVKPVANGSMEGTLSWKLAFPPDFDYDKANFFIGNNITIDLNSSPAAADHLLAPGIYVVRAVLQANGRYAGYTRVVHIYAGMATELDWEFYDYHFEFTRPVLAKAEINFDAVAANYRVTGITLKSADKVLSTVTGSASPLFDFKVDMEEESFEDLYMEIVTPENTITTEALLSVAIPDDDSEIDLGTVDVYTMAVEVRGPAGAQESAEVLLTDGPLGSISGIKPNPQAVHLLGGETVTLTVEEAEDFMFMGFDYEPKGEFAAAPIQTDKQYEFTMPNASVTVAVEYRSTIHTVTIEKGYATPSGDRYKEGTEVEIDAGENWRPGLIFDGWTAKMALDDDDADIDVVFTDGIGTTAKFIMPEHEVFLVANWVQENPDPEVPPYEWIVLYIRIPGDYNYVHLQVPVGSTLDIQRVFINSAMSLPGATICDFTNGPGGVQNALNQQLRDNVDAALKMYHKVGVVPDEKGLDYGGGIQYNFANNQYLGFVVPYDWEPGGSYLEFADPITRREFIVKDQIIPVEPPRPFKVAFDGNGETAGDAPAMIKEDELDAGITLPDEETLARDNYTFGGWSESAAGTDAKAAGAAYYPEKDITLYAVWNFRITYNANGGAGVPGNSVAPAGSTVRLPGKGNLIKDPEDGDPPLYFAGWNTKADGKGDNYLIMEEALTYTDDGIIGNITLYAVWVDTPVDTWVTLYFGNPPYPGNNFVRIRAKNEGDKLYIQKVFSSNTNSGDDGIGNNGHGVYFIDARATPKITDGNQVLHSTNNITDSKLSEDRDSWVYTGPSDICELNVSNPAEKAYFGIRFKCEGEAQIVFTGNDWNNAAQARTFDKNGIK